MIILLHMAFHLLVAVSWYTAGTGFAAVLGEGPPVMGYMVSAVLQVVLAVSVLRLVPHTLTEAIQCPLWWGMYLMAAVVSLTFAIGFYFSIFSSKEYGESLFYGAYEKTFGQVSALFRGLDDLVGRVDGLSQFSDQMARIEEIGGGGTCQYARGSGQGPYHHKRTYQAERFGQLRNEFQRARKRAEANVASMEALERSEAPVDRKLAELARLYRAFKVDYDQIAAHAYRQELSDHAAWEFDGFPPRPEFARFAGRERACGDSRTVAKLKAVLDVTMPLPPEVDIPRFSPDDRKAVIELVITDIFRLLKGAPDGGSVLGNERYIMPIAIGALVDAVLLLLAIAINLVGRKRETAPDHGDDRRLLAKLYRALSQLPTRHSDLMLPMGGSLNPETAAGATESLQALLRGISVKIGSKQYLFQPAEHAGSEQLLSPRSLSYLALVTDVVHVLDHYRLLGSRLGPTTEYSGWTLLEATKPIGLGPTDLGVNGHFYVYPLEDRLMTVLVRSASDTSDLFLRRRWPLAALLGHARGLHDDGLPSALVGDRGFYARQVHERLHRCDGGWELVLYPDTAKVDRLLCAWLRDDDDDMSSLVEEQPRSLLRPGLRRFRFGMPAKRKIEELVATTAGAPLP